MRRYLNRVLPSRLLTVLPILLIATLVAAAPMVAADEAETSAEPMVVSTFPAQGLIMPALPLPPDLAPPAELVVLLDQPISVTPADIVVGSSVGQAIEVEEVTPLDDELTMHRILLSAALANDSSLWIQLPGDQLVVLTRIAGDVSQDGSLDDEDLVALENAVADGSTDLDQFDLNADGVVDDFDVIDLDIFLQVAQHGPRVFVCCQTSDSCVQVRGTTCWTGLQVDCPCDGGSS